MLTDIATPFLAVDLAVLEHNITRMATRAQDLGAALRPHAKTHKSTHIAKLQVAAGAKGLTVATLGEALTFAEAGVADIFVAYPLWLDRPHRLRLEQVLATGVKLRIGTDSAAAARQLLDFSDAVELLVEIDSGEHRSGVTPSRAGPTAVDIAEMGFRVVGAFTFPGHAYSPGSAAPAAEDEHQALSQSSASMKDHGIVPEVLSGGSTPSVAFGPPDVATELRPGTYVFSDAQQWELGICQPSDIALVAYASVVSSRPGHVVLDSGGKTLGADRASWATGFGRLLDYPDARIIRLSEHHAVVAWNGDRQPSVGERVRVVPNHVCNAVNLVDKFAIVSQGEHVETWPVSARGM
ncbi:alanine racemase [Streptomyces sp. RS2]|uniref:alanine racemase n=1 Tax=Streptomyces sp. RS2 TaxID=1451205 RepID=UPI0021F8AFE4|nr:alanine racemase [Streptomyces sp. RS2]MCW1100126.1 alanine racemase [Streptomyces sp. RS2]